jgi:phosphoserine phosphatase
MSVKPFSPTLLKQILEPIDAFIAKNPGPHYAAFDADGTLWDSDVGENFFQYKIDFCNLPELAAMDPWEHYFSLKKKYPPDAYLWLAQLCATQEITTIRQWAAQTMDVFPPLVLSPQKALIEELLKRHLKIFIVSASTHWAVEAAASLVGLDADSALGVKTKVVNSRVTKEQDGPITWREGKKTALLEKTKGVSPIFCSGNSSGDLHLLECSS